MPFGGLLTVGIIGATGAFGGAAVGAHAAGKAAKTQADAAMAATQLQREMFDQQQKNLQPWLDTGQGALMQLKDLLNPTSEMMQGWTKQFVAPTMQDVENDPGFKTRMEAGQRALEASAAAKGGVLSGGTLKATQRYGQDYGSNEFEKVYGRALGEYQQAYNQFEQKSANKFNRLASVAGIGQTATGELNSASQNAGKNIADLNTSAAAARASGYVGGANAWGNAVGNIGNQMMNLSMMNRVFPQTPQYETLGV